MEIFKDNVAKEIIKLRNGLGLTQTDFAKRLGKDQRTISAYENGVVWPPVDILHQIAEEFNVKVEISTEYVKFKELDSINDNIRKQICAFILNNVVSDDFKQEDLIEYKYLVERYKDKLPSYFEDKVNELYLDKSKIVGAVSKDNYRWLYVYYMNDDRALLLFKQDSVFEWENNLYSFDIFDLENYFDEKIDPEYLYVYDSNPLWLAYLQRDIDVISKEALVAAFRTCIDTLLTLKDERHRLLDLMDIEKLKEYIDDYSLGKETVEAVITKYIDIDNNDHLRVAISSPQQFEFFINKAPHALVNIPSNEIILCGDFDEIILNKDYYKSLKKSLYNLPYRN